MLQPDVGAQEPYDTVDNNSYYTGGAYYYVQAADDTRSSSGGSQAGGMRLFQYVSQFVLAILWQLVNLCLY